MKTGLFIPYHRSDACLAALRVAQVASDAGLDIDILAKNSPEPVSATWDRRVLQNIDDFETWVRSGLSHLILTDVEPSESILAIRQQGVKTYLLPSWNRLDDSNAKDLHAFTSVISPHKCIDKLLKKELGLENSQYIPFDPGVPITHNEDTDPQWLGLIWPLENSQIIYQGAESLALIIKIMKQLPDVWLTVMCSPNVTGDSWRKLRKFADAFEGRVELMRGMSPERQAMLYARHDLTLWPSLNEDYGLTGLTSIYMGTPVLAFDVPPISDFVKNNQNGVLVACELGEAAFGVPYAIANLEEYVKAAVDLISHPDRLFKLRKTTNYGLGNRRDEFVKSWSALLLS